MILAIFSSSEIEVVEYIKNAKRAFLDFLLRTNLGDVIVSYSIFITIKNVVCCINVLEMWLIDHKYCQYGQKSFLLPKEEKIP